MPIVPFFIGLVFVLATIAVGFAKGDYMYMNCALYMFWFNVMLHYIRNFNRHNRLLMQDHIINIVTVVAMLTMLTFAKEGILVVFTYTAFCALLLWLLVYDYVNLFFIGRKLRNEEMRMALKDILSALEAVESGKHGIISRRN